MGDKLGLYLHIPFWRSKCAYCDFYSLAGRLVRAFPFSAAVMITIFGMTSYLDMAS